MHRIWIDMECSCILQYESGLRMNRSCIVWAMDGLFLTLQSCQYCLDSIFLTCEANAMLHPMPITPSYLPSRLQSKRALKLTPAVMSDSTKVSDHLICGQCSLPASSVALSASPQVQSLASVRHVSFVPVP